jgi:Tol biopolymer transport system component
MQGSRIRSLAALVAACCAACGARISAGDPDDLMQGGGTTDAPSSPTTDGGTTIDAPLGPWGTPTPVSAASSTTVDEDDETLSSTGLEMIFAISGTNGVKDLYYTSRPSVTATWSAPAVITTLDSTASNETPRLSADDKTLYFASGRAPNNKTGQLDIYSATRATTGPGNGDAWTTITQVSGVNSTTKTDKWYMPCGGDFIEVRDNGATGTDFFGGAIGTAGTEITELSSAGSETGTFLSKDCLTIYFASDRSGDSMIYMSTRPNATTAWNPPTAVTDFPVNMSTIKEEDPWMSNDQRTFVFVSAEAGTKDVYISTR